MCCMQLFVNDRRVITEPAMKAKRVVPRLQEVEDLAPCLFMRGEVRARQQLAFKGGEKTFAHGVVEAIRHRPHRQTHASLVATPPEGNQGALATLSEWWITRSGRRYASAMSSARNISSVCITRSY